MVEKEDGDGGGDRQGVSCRLHDDYQNMERERGGRCRSRERRAVESQSKAVNKQFVFRARTHERQHHTPQSRSSSMDTTRKAFSVGTKRSDVNLDYENALKCQTSMDTSRKAFSVGTKRSYVNLDFENALKCKRALHFASTSSSSEITMFDYARRGLTENITIPYMQDKRKLGKESTKLILLNAYGLVIDLHSEDKTLKGLFSSKNFLISPRRKTVTLWGIQPQGYAKGDGTADKSQFVMMVKVMFGDDLPEDIKIWLDCIKNGGHENVVRNHINMLHADRIFGEFCLMYHCLLEMKDLDEAKFERLLETLFTYDGWDSKKFKWCLLENNRRYQDQNADNRTGRHHKGDPHADDKTGRHYKETAFGLMQELRNCWEHPARRYKRFLMAVLLSECPKLLSDVQQALYNAGYLPHLDIENMD